MSVKDIKTADWRILTYFLAEVSDWLVILVKNDADLVHQPNLFSIMAIELSRACVDVRKEPQDTLRRNGLDMSESSRGRHCKGSRGFLSWEEMPHGSRYIPRRPRFVELIFPRNSRRATRCSLGRFSECGDLDDGTLQDGKSFLERWRKLDQIVFA